MKARSIALTPEEKAELELVVRRTTSAARDVFRVGMILRAAAGSSNEEIAAAMKTRPVTVSKWRGRFLCDRISGLQDAPRPGKPATYDLKSERRILTQLDQPPPKGYARWNGVLLAAALKPSPTTRFGVFCACMGFRWNGVTVGASRPIPVLPRKLPT